MRTLNPLIVAFVSAHCWPQEYSDGKRYNSNNNNQLCAFSCKSKNLQQKTLIFIERINETCFALFVERASNIKVGKWPWLSLLNSKVKIRWILALI